MELQRKIIDTQILNGRMLAKNFPFIRYWVQNLSIIIISVTLPAFLFLIFQNYASTEGLAIESGCHGPELGFGMLSGVLMCLQLRFFTSHSDS
jgi:hypothetical protein|tara:strand:+ start:495 stop:773 length:279 start_codon:yes stop_codon:yes gene_type:complete